jgi:hypothetical protein
VLTDASNDLLLDKDFNKTTNSSGSKQFDKSSNTDNIKINIIPPDYISTNDS